MFLAKLILKEGCFPFWPDRYHILLKLMKVFFSCCCFLTTVFISLVSYWGFPGGSDCKESACNAGDLDSIPESGRSPGEWNGYPLQYSCLENSMDRRAGWAIVHGIVKSWTLSLIQGTQLFCH